MVLVILLANEVLGSQCYATAPSAFITGIHDDLSFYGLRSALVACISNSHPCPHTPWTLLSLSFWCFSFPLTFFCSRIFREILVLHWTLPVQVTDGCRYFRFHPVLHDLLYFASLFMTENSPQIPALSGSTRRPTLMLWPVWVSVWTSSATRLPYLSPRTHGLLGKMCKF